MELLRELLASGTALVAFIFVLGLAMLSTFFKGDNDDK